MRRPGRNALALLLSALTSSGCLWEECPDYGPPPPVASGRYQGIVHSDVPSTDGVRSSIPAEGTRVTATVDRNVGTVQMQWTASDGRVVVETWRMRRVTP